jgi:hypothetical protein
MSVDNKSTQDILQRITNWTVGAIRILSGASNAQIGTEKTVTYANNDAANTIKTITDIAQPVDLAKEYLIMVENPSTETDLTVRIYLKQTFNNVVRWGYYTLFAVKKSTDTYNPDQVNKISVGVARVSGAMLAQGIGLSITNDTLIGAAGTFVGRVIVREV